MRDTLAKLRYDLLVRTADEYVIEYDGVLLDAAAVPLSYEVYRTIGGGWYERQEASLIRELLPPGFDVLELGAGIGYISCLIDNVLVEDRTHVAVEPDPEAIRALRATKRLNGADYIVCERAYSSSGPVSIDTHGEYWDTSPKPGSGPVSIRSATIADLCSMYDVSTCSLVVDIEGWEYDLFTAELTVLENRCPFLLVEFHGHDPANSGFRNEIDESDFELVAGIESVCAYWNSNFERSGTDK